LTGNESPVACHIEIEKGNPKRIAWGFFDPGPEHRNRARGWKLLSVRACAFLVHACVVCGASFAPSASARNTLGSILRLRLRTTRARRELGHDNKMLICARSIFPEQEFRTIKPSRKPCSPVCQVALNLPQPLGSPKTGATQRPACVRLEI